MTVKFPPVKISPKLGIFKGTQGIAGLNYIKLELFYTSFWRILLENSEIFGMLPAVTLNIWITRTLLHFNYITVNTRLNPFAYFMSSDSGDWVKAGTELISLLPSSKSATEWLESYSYYTVLQSYRPLIHMVSFCLFFCITATCWAAVDQCVKKSNEV